jgi:hypothetical protein
MVNFPADARSPPPLEKKLAPRRLNLAYLRATVRAIVDFHSASHTLEPIYVFFSIAVRPFLDLFKDISSCVLEAGRRILSACGVKLGFWETVEELRRTVA